MRPERVVRGCGGVLANVTFFFGSVVVVGSLLDVAETSGWTVDDVLGVTGSTGDFFCMVPVAFGGDGWSSLIPKAGLSLSTVILVGLFFISTLKTLGPRFSTKNGPSYGGVRAAVTRSFRTNTCEHLLISANMNGFSFAWLDVSDGLMLWMIFFRSAIKST